MVVLEQVLWWAKSRLNAEVEEREDERESESGLLAYSQLRRKNQDILWDRQVGHVFMVVS